MATNHIQRERSIFRVLDDNGEIVDVLKASKRFIKDYQPMLSYVKVSLVLFTKSLWKKYYPKLDLIKLLFKTANRMLKTIKLTEKAPSVRLWQTLLQASALDVSDNPGAEDSIVPATESAVEDIKFRLEQYELVPFAHLIYLVEKKRLSFSDPFIDGIKNFTANYNTEIANVVIGCGNLADFGKSINSVIEKLGPADFSLYPQEKSLNLKI